MLLKKIARFLAITTGIVAILLLLCQAFISFYLNDHVRDIIEERVAEGSEGRYEAKIGEVSLNVFKSSFILSSVALIPNRKLIGDDAAASLVADEIKMSGIQLIAFIRRKEVVAEQLTFERPVILLFQKAPVLPGDSVVKKVLLYSVLQKNIRGIAIKKVNIDNALFRIYSHVTKNELLSSSENEIRIENFLVNQKIDSLGQHFTAEKFRVHLNECMYYPPGGLYEMRAKKFAASYNDSLLQVESIELIPKFTKRNFGKAAGKQSSRVKLKANGVRFSTMNVQMFLERNWFLCKNLDIDRLIINVHRDKNVKLKKERKPSLQKVLYDIPFKTIIDTVKVAYSDITYEHLADDGDKAGKITFNKLKAVITGLNNDTIKVKGKKKSALKMKIRGLFMNQAKIKTEYHFPMNTEKEVFTCSGAVYNLKMEHINHMLENTVYVSIREGTADSVLFSFNADESYSYGKMKFLYHDLKIDILRKTDEHKKRKILSAMANRFLIKDSNPRKNGEVYVSQIRYDRYPYKFFFYYTWKSLQSGIMDAIGIDSQFILKRSDDK